MEATILWFAIGCGLLVMSLIWNLGMRNELKAQKKFDLRTMKAAGGRVVHVLTTDGGIHWQVLDPDLFPKEHKYLGSVKKLCPELVPELCANSQGMTLPGGTRNMYGDAAEALNKRLRLPLIAGLAKDRGAALLDTLTGGRGEAFLSRKHLQ